MLRYLSIENFALIDRSEIDFAKGLNVLTGETGAGKSILLDALQLLAGARASLDAVRDPARPAVVQGIFEVPDDRLAQVNAALDERGIDTAGNDLIVRRLVRAEGRGRAYINGAVVSVATLARDCRSES